ncbi:MAG: phage virion morphogenesis protein [Zoogloeaceae bacterium]|nr:phage virion morphogenesis protein [Zoogloeaceae bacterium]
MQSCRQGTGEVQATDQATDPSLERSRQGGGTVRLVKKVTIPARPFLGLSGKDKTTVLDILRHFLAESLPRQSVAFLQHPVPPSPASPHHLSHSWI